jgi:hypothetical protein
MLSIKIGRRWDVQVLHAAIDSGAQVRYTVWWRWRSGN